MSNPEYLGLGADDGTILGRSATDKVAFYGATPIVQRSTTAAAVATTAVTTAAGIYGFTTAAQAAAIVALVNELRADMIALGLKA